MHASAFFVSIEHLGIVQEQMKEEWKNPDTDVISFQMMPNKI